MDLHDVQQQPGQGAAIHHHHHHLHQQIHHPQLDPLHHHLPPQDSLFRPFDHFQLYNNHDLFAPPSDAPASPTPSKSPERPLELSNLDDEPLYVNAKQYFRILKRRVARTRLEELHRLSRQRKPYLHESRHKHAMRRPRGPGGRFLTAEEIAAQKQAAQDEPSSSALPAAADNDPEDDPEDDDSKPDDSSASPVPDPEVFMAHQPPPPDSMGIISMAYRSPISIPPPAASRPAPSPPSVYPTQPQSSQQEPQDKGASVTLTSPYSVQMHHIPHPHAHARHHHSINPYLYHADAVDSTADPEMQRRTEEVIQFGAGPS